MNLKEAIREAVAERGEDWTYPEPEEKGQEDNWHYTTGGCRYVTRDEKEPACLFGAALMKMGFSAEDLDVLSSASDLMSALGGFTLEEMCAAEGAQSLQDAGRTWGEAEKTFLEVLETW